MRAFYLHIAPQIVAEALSTLVEHDGSDAVGAMLSALRESVAASDVTLKSKPVQVGTGGTLSHLPCYHRVL